MPKEETKESKPDKDKKPASAFFMYTKSVRESVKSSNPSLTHRELIKKISEDWKTLPDSEKKVFQDEYDKQITEYRNSHPKTKEKKSPKAKKTEAKQPIKKKPAGK